MEDTLSNTAATALPATGAPHSWFLLLLTGAAIGVASYVTGARTVVVPPVVSPPVIAKAAVEPSMPQTVNVFGTNWTVLEVQYPADNNDLLGYTSCQLHMIELKRGYDKTREGLAHELMHAMVCGTASDGYDVNNMYWNSSNPYKHEGIYRMAKAWAELLHENPALAAYLGS